MSNERPMTRTRNWIAGGVVAAVAGATLAGLAWRDRLPWQHPPEPSAPRALEPAPRNAASPTAPECPGRAPLALDGSYAFTVSTDMRARAGEGVQTQAAPPITIALDGTLDASSRADERGGRVVELQVVLASAKMSEAAEQASALGAGDWRATASRPWRMHVEGSGLVSRVTFDPAIPPSLQAILQEVASAAQVVWSDDCEGPAAWTATEAHASAPASVSYTRNRREIRKRYLEEAKGGIYRATGSASLAVTEARIDTVDQEVALEVHPSAQADGGGFHLSGRGRVTLRRTGAGQHLAAAPAPNAPSLPFVPLDRRAMGRKVEAAMDKQAVQGRSLSQVLDALGAADQGKPAEQASARAALESLLRLDPNASDELADLLVANRLSTALAQLAIGALGATPRGVQRLGGMLDNSEASDGLRRDAALVSGFVEETTEELALALERASHDEDKAVAVASLVAFGVTLGRLELETPSSQSQALTLSFVGRAIGELAAVGPDTVGVPDLTMAMRWLDAVAATRSPDAYVLLERALLDEEEWIRAAAARAIQFFPTPQTVEHLSVLLRTDPSPDVRRSALIAARVLGEGLTLELVRKALVEDKVNWVRTQAAYAISAWASERPGLRSVLQQALAVEKDDSVREILRNHITPNRNAGVVKEELPGTPREAP
jgi:HEAT repeat protein